EAPYAGIATARNPVLLDSPIPSGSSIPPGIPENADGRPAPQDLPSRIRAGKWEETGMQGLMMDVPLLVSAMIDHAAECHGGQEVVSRELDGRIHRYTYRDAQRRT